MEEKQKGYLLGIVGALIGGLIGTIPWIILYVYANMIYSLLAFIVAMAALKGYELFKGKVDKKLPYIIGAISIICITIATLVIIPNLLLVKEIGTTSLANFKLLYADSEFAGAIIGDYIMSLLFTILGISGVFASIKKQVNNGSQKIDLNYNENAVSDEDRTQIKEIFVKYNALDKHNTISKETLLRENEDLEEKINYLVSIGIIKIYKKEYYYNEKNENKKVSKTKSWVIIAIVFAVLLGVGIFSSSLSDDNQKETTENRVITYSIPKGYQEYDYDDETGTGWYYLPKKDLSGDSGGIDVSYATDATLLENIDVLKDSINNSFTTAGYKVISSNDIENDKGYRVLEYVIEIEDYKEYIYYIFNDDDYAIVDGIEYTDKKDNTVESATKEIANSLKWNK
ncbi:MAG: hypothetical protein IJY87_03765 [Bacilli bacterium]|nr:hypothetical protein [Bacilli bacterium]